MANNNSYIFNEEASGTIDWVNTTFTLANTIETIESLRIWYVEYTDFSFSGNTIILADAPSVLNGWVFVDYFYDATVNTFDPVNLIYGEVLVWDIDGVNKVFTTVYPIGLIDELRVDGLSYTAFTYNGRFITLATAPSSSIVSIDIDYYRKDVDNPYIESGVTLAWLRSSIYTRIGQQITSLQFPKELADEYITEGITRISKMKRDRKKRGVFSFHKAYDTSVISTDGNIIALWTVSKYLPWKGIAIVDNWDVVYYAGKSTTGINSLSDLELDAIEDSKIQFGYKLSKNVDKISEVFIDWFKLNPADFSEYRSNKNVSDFSVYNGYLFLPFSVVDGSVVTVVYFAKNSTTYTDTDIIDFDGDYMPVIKAFVLWNMYHDREDDRENKEYARYKEVLREYKRELSKQYETTSAVFGYGWPSIG